MKLRNKKLMNKYVDQFFRIFAIHFSLLSSLLYQTALRDTLASLHRNT